MKRDLSSLLQPRHIAVIGGGAWCEQVLRRARDMGFGGDIWPVHPRGGVRAGIPVYSRLEDLPAPPDATFIGINRHATIEAIAVLNAMGAGGAVCFASGFSEASAEDSSGVGLQAQLLNAAGDMPILGPNCYGFINALDGMLLWPDQHGCKRVEKGVAILTQSSNIAINLSMQTRALPIAYLITCGNMAQTSQAEIANAMLDDPRVSAIGLHIEGFSDLRGWEALAAKAVEKGVPLLALKVGRSSQAQAATISHTASLAGGDAGANALLERLGIARLNSLPAFLEALKLAHVIGPLASNRIASISCSGGEASLVADMALAHGIEFPPLGAHQKTALADALGPMVALANPLDYHTYIWRDTKAMTRAWAAIVDPAIALTTIIVDYPRADICDASDWQCATDAVINVRAQTGANIAVVASLPELMPEAIAQELISAGVVPLSGLDEALAAIAACGSLAGEANDPLLLPGGEREAIMLSEAEAKACLAQFGLEVPAKKSGTNPAHLSKDLTFPLVLKGQGFAHKTEAGAVALNLSNVQEVTQAAVNMNADTFLLEEMVTGGVAELLVGVTRDPAHGFVLTLAAGGTLTELLEDKVSLLIPSTPKALKKALTRLKIYKLLRGFRNAPGADIPAILDAIDAIQTYVLANAERVEEVEVNPLICTPSRAVAVDALIREAPAND